ncbi:DEAD/DEAH box helicase [Novosphingobium sp. KN65.2]|uniref:DEAD/DEAH box helicase n=1 Tax=Novosphingobium sp. KN65.2 TaxID=1478134 RepID=UPI0005E87260|nr:DEAD/DEAH box helicase [Novosphingobium sp. KN65.2]CDO34972.1 DEAD/DEAH box helicase [Novosphingobium sp. KN65.2]
MRIADLQSWLLDQGIEDELDQLTRHTVRGEIGNLVPEPDGVASPVDWQRLLLAASVLARSNTRSHQEAALRIATSAVTMSKSAAVIDAGAVLLGKLSNFRAVALAGKRALLADDLDGRLGMNLRIEAQHRQMEQAVLVESSGRWLQVNDFQQRFWEKAAVNGWISASAPTASGKTFLVLQWLIDQMHDGAKRVAVYLAPTRALVTEIETNLELLLGKPGAIQISSLPLTEKYDAARLGGAPLILVFTQERLHLLANLVGDDIAIDLLIVDEAHKIGDNQRGVILQDAIERIGRANPALKLVFISPATQNPGELLADAPDGTATAPVDSDVPTVLQNVIIAEQVPRKPKLWDLSVVKADGKQLIGRLKLASSPTGPTKKLAFIAAAAGVQGGTLVYANRASDSEEIADLISQLIPTSAIVDTELLELADLTRKGVHPQYRLAPLVERGVAFHYGNMPSLIRLEIERLFRAGKIRFLVCTSTLIEGVNLSCRTIVLRGPRKGLGNPMEPHDFWNLAGRAGRWGDEFQGNIICIDPGNSQAWPHGVPARARYPIKRESDAVIETGTGLSDYLDHRVSADLSELPEADQYEQVGAYLLTTFLRLGSIAEAGLAKRHDKALIARLDASLAAIAAQIEIGPEIANRHPGISALGLQRMLDAFRRYEGDPENLLPAPVDSEDSYDRFVTIMRRINQNMFPAFSPEGLIPLYARIVVQWLKGFSLAMMIRRNIEYHVRNKRDYKLPTLIRQTMEHVEQIARFKAPKYFSAYMDVLHIHLRAIGRDDLVEDGLDIATQLEFGVSSRTLLSLMELGLSRMSAVALYEKIARDDLDKAQCRAWVADRLNEFPGMDIPAIILREILERLHPDAESQTTPSAS